MKKNCILFTATASTVCLLSACHSPPAYEHKEETPATRSSSPQGEQASSISSSTQSTPANTTNTSSNKAVEFKNGDGQKAFFLTHADKTGNVCGADGNYLFTFMEKVHEGKILLREQNKEGKFVTYVSMPSADHLKIEDEAHKELYKLKMDDEHIKLKDAQGNTVYKLKHEDYGIKIEDGDTKNVLYKVKTKEGKISLKTEDGKIVLSSDASMAPEVIACFGMDKLTKDQQYALAYALMFLRN